MAHYKYSWSSSSSSSSSSASYYINMQTSLPATLTSRPLAVHCYNWVNTYVATCAYSLTFQSVTCMPVTHCSAGRQRATANIAWLRGLHLQAQTAFKTSWAQCTSPTPTRRNCFVASRRRRRCVLGIRPNTVTLLKAGQTPTQNTDIGYDNNGVNKHQPSKESLCKTNFSERQHAERSICYRKSVCSSVRLSACPSHGWISRKRLKLGSCNFHYTVAPSL